MDTVRRISRRTIPVWAATMLLTASWFLKGTAKAQENPADIQASETQTAQPDRNMFREATFILPEGAAISSRWVLPPTEITRIEAEFSIDASGNPLIGVGSFYSSLVNPFEAYNVVLEEKISGFTHLENGVLLLASGRSIGLLAEPKQKAFDDKKVPIAGFQPLTSLPVKEISVLASVGNAVYCAGLNPQTDRYALYLLRVVKGAGVKDLELIHESADAITAVAGNDEATYVAKGRSVVRVSRKDGSVTPLYTHPSAAVTELEITPAGLLVSTNKELVLTGENGAMEIMRSSGHRIDYGGNTLYLFFPKSMGVLALDNMADLGRFNLAVRPVAAGEVPLPLEITGVDFFESAPPPYAQMSFAESFDRENVRSIVARIDYGSRAVSQEAERHTITVSWFEPMGGRLLSASYPVEGTGQLYASIGKEPEGEGYTPPPVGTGGTVWRFGDDRLGLRYPGRYRVAVQVDGIPAGEWSFVLTGSPKPVETLIYNDLTALETLLNEGLSPRYKNEAGTPLLNNAILFGSTRSVELLLNRGADPNDVNSDGIPALDVATGMFPQAADWRAKAELLVNRGANVNALVGENKEPLIHRNTFQPDRMAFLVEKGADINVRSAYRATVLGEVVSSEGLCSTEMISLLAGRGANLNAPFDTGLGSFEKYTSLGLAISDGNYECVSALLDHGASLSVAQARHNATTPERSALYVALQKLYAEKENDTGKISARRRIVQLLLEKGASLNRGKKQADLPFDPACAERYDNSECYSRTMDNSLMLMNGEGRVMFRGEGPSIFSTSDMIMALEQDDAALDEADQSQDPAIRELALQAHLGRIRELAVAARNVYGLYDAHDHCEKAFSLAEPRYRAMQLDVVPDIQGASQNSMEKSFLGVLLLKREEGGAYIQRLASGGAAEKAGLRIGDIILALDTQKIKDAEEIASTVTRLTPGMPVRVTFLRDDPMLIPDLYLSCGLLEKGMDKKELAEMNLMRWLSANPDASQAREVGNHIKELTKETKR